MLGGWKEETGWLYKKFAKIFGQFCSFCRLSPFINSEWSHSLKLPHTITSFPPLISFHIPPNTNSATVKMEITHFFENLEHTYFASW